LYLFPEFRVTIHKIPRRRKVHRSRKTNRKNKKKASEYIVLRYTRLMTWVAVYVVN